MRAHSRPVLPGPFHATSQNPQDSRIHSPRFDCCVFSYSSLSAVTFATQYPSKRTCVSCLDMSLQCFVAAPSWQEFSSRLRAGRCRHVTVRLVIWHPPLMTWHHDWCAARHNPVRPSEARPAGGNQHPWSPGRQGHRCSKKARPAPEVRSGYRHRASVRRDRAYRGRTVLGEWLRDCS